MQKNITILIPTINAGGAEKQATILATILDKHYKVDIYLLYGEIKPSPQNLEILCNSNVKVHYLKGSLLSRLSKLKKLLKENKTTVLLNYLTSCNFWGAIVGRMCGIKHIYGGIRNADMEWSKTLSERFIHNHFSTGTIYNCYSGEEHFTHKRFKKCKSIVIPNCFLNIAPAIKRENKDVKEIVTVGRFVPQKDYETIIKTIAALKTMRHDFIMNIIGYGEEEKNIRNWIKSYGVEDCIKIHIRPNNVQDIVKASDIYLSTSLFEGTSNSIMEALNWSLPVVATNVGDNNHLVLEGKNGMLHPIGDTEGLARSLSTLLDSIELRNEYGRESNTNLRENYSKEIFEKRYLELIEK